MTTRCLDCHALTATGPRCTMHQRAAKQSRNAPRFAQSGGGWGITAMRQRIARRDAACVNCGGIDTWELDHIVPLARGGAWSESNLQRLCVRCHRAKTARAMR